MLYRSSYLSLNENCNFVKIILENQELLKFGELKVLGFILCVVSVLDINYYVLYWFEDF